MRTYLPDPSTFTADGVFAFHGVAADSYSLVMTPAPGAYLKSVKLGNRELPDLRIDLSGGAAPLAIPLGTDGGRIQGAVQNAAGEPAARTPVTLFPEGRQRDRQDRAETVLTGAAGKYAFQDIAPGDYRLYAWESGDLDAARDASFRKPYEGQSVAVSVTPRGSLTVALKKVSAQ